MKARYALFLYLALFSGLAAAEEPQPLIADVQRRADALKDKIIAWRRDIHEHPELGDQETRTAALVAEHLRSLKLDEVRTEVARTGVVGLLTGGQPGPLVALRADMDALPIKEPPGLPFASKATGRYHGKEVPLMHACGHDGHTAMLMGAAELLAEMREELRGSVLFIFQPAEEGSSLYAPESGERWGARLMLEEGLFAKRKPDAIFALHLMPVTFGHLLFRSGPTTASGDTLRITVTGQSGHGGMPWNANDPITSSAMIIAGLQTVVSRSANLTESPLVVSIGTIEGGSGPNIIADSVAMSGTIRTYDEEARERAHRDIRQIVENFAKATDTTAAVSITRIYDTTINDPALTEQMTPVLARASGNKVQKASLAGASEDFSFYAQQVPGLFVFLGAAPPGQNQASVAPNHNPKFFIDEGALPIGTRVLTELTLSFMQSAAAEQ